MRLKAIFLIFTIQPLLFLGSASAYSEHWLYSFRPGDTLWGICRQFTTRSNCWQTLGKENGIDFARRIPPGTVIKFPISWLKTIPKPVTISYVRGNVIHSSSTTDSVSAKSGDDLPIGTVISVGEDSNATLKFADGTIMLLEENSELLLDALSANGDTGMVDSRVRLNRGAATTQVPQRKDRIRFQIETPSSVAAVRGTEFRVSADENNINLSRAEVLEGIVDVKTTVTGQNVNQGYGITAEKDAPPSKPIQLLPAPVFTTKETFQLVDININWQPIDGAISYRSTLLSKNNSDPTADQIILKTKETTEASIQWTLLPIACYETEIRAIDKNKLIGLPASFDVCVEAALAKVNLKRSSIKKLGENRLNVNWPQVSNANSYTVEYSLYEDFRSPEKFETNTNSITIDADTSQHYFVRVYAKNASGVSSPTGSVASWSPTFWDKYIAIGATALVLILIL